MDKWLGGACPVDAHKIVEFELRDGTRSRALAGILRWRHGKDGNPEHPKDIVAFRAVDSSSGFVGVSTPLTARLIEADPDGLDPHAKGAKLDAGKTRPGLVLHGFARALQAVSEVGTYGARKYTDNGWCEVKGGVERYTDAMYRHTLREAQGEQCDPDTGMLHAAHAAWNALARLDLMLRERGEQC